MLSIPKSYLCEINFFINGLTYPIVVYGNESQTDTIKRISEISPYHVNTIARYCRENKLRYQELKTFLR